MRIAPLLLISFFAGCSSRVDQISHEAQFLAPVETLRTELRNPEFEWHGPTSREDRIPVLHAARALAYRGDSAAPILFDAVDDPVVEIYSVLDAISELGIPAYNFHDEIMNRKSAGLREWWNKNKTSSKASRNEHRYHIGLPPTTIGT